jgi:hypothetical protein
MSFLDEWMKADDQASDFDLIPEGKHVVEAVEFKLDITKEPARATMVYSFGGDLAGRRLWANYQLKGQGLGIMKRDLKTLGVDISTIKSVEDMANKVWAVLPLRVEITVKHNESKGKTYANGYLNKVLASGPANSNSELPF